MYNAWRRMLRISCQNCCRVPLVVWLCPALNFLLPPSPYQSLLPLDMIKISGFDSRQCIDPFSLILLSGVFMCVLGSDSADASKMDDAFQFSSRDEEAVLMPMQCCRGYAGRLALAAAQRLMAGFEWRLGLSSTTYISRLYCSSRARQQVLCRSAVANPVRHLSSQGMLPVKLWNVMEPAQ
jgi:hypothetical protein